MQESNILGRWEYTKEISCELRVNADDRNREACDVVLRFVENETDSVKSGTCSVPITREQFMELGIWMGWLPKPELKITASHSLLHRMIYVYDQDDNVLFTIDEEDFTNMVKRNPRLLDDDQIAKLVGEHWKTEIDDLTNKRAEDLALEKAEEEAYGEPDEF